jgi:glycine C-acetyltransferase
MNRREAIASYADALEELKTAGLYKAERLIETPQDVRIRVKGEEVLNFCANNYLGLSNDETIKAAAKKGLDEYGFGLSSVRFICGTQTIHKTLESKVSAFLGTDDTLLYSSCFDANGGLFETILGEDDAVVSDALNHASIIDGIRLCKAARYRYANGDMAALRGVLREARDKGAQKVLIATDGVFSMDGYVAKLQDICALADEFEAMVMVDDSHATGFFGPTGRGSIEYCGVMGRVDIITSTLGKALGGASGGFTSGRKEIVALLRQRSRPYLFSNSVAPAVVTASIACLDMLASSTALRDRLADNTKLFRDEMTKAGFDIKEGPHPIVPVMIGDARLATQLADALLEEGIYVIGFSYPVVPKGQARIRTQISAAHSRADQERAVAAFRAAAHKLGILP